MYRLLVAVGLAAGCWLGSQAADVPADAADAADAGRKPDELIKDLASPDYRLRERAGRELARRGEQVLGELRAALAVTEDAEAARRLGVLVRKMEYDRLVTPKRVTLHLKDRPYREAIDAVAKQTGYRIDFTANRGDTRFTFDMENIPFWQAIDTIGNAAGLNIYPESDDGTIRVYEQDAHNPHVTYAGPFRFMATNINSSRNIQLAGINRRAGVRPQNESISLNFSIQSEPKTPILGTTFVELTSAVDDTGASLVPQTNDENRHMYSRYYGGGSNHGYSVYANLNLARGGKGDGLAKSIKGKVGVLLLAGTRPEITILNPVGLKEKKVVGRTVEITVESVTENQEQYSLSVTVKQLSGNDGQQDYSWISNVWQKFELHDDKGQKLRNHGANNINNSPNVVQISGTFGREERQGKKPGKPVKLVYNEWITAVSEVPFEFKDIPLP